MGHDKEVPQLTRFVALAYARNDSNGHARFERGELAGILCVDRRNVGKLIDRAVRDRWLDKLSCSECLVTPPHISDRLKTAELCPVHERIAARQRARKMSYKSGDITP
jgi:hypothetical protein